MNKPRSTRQSSAGPNLQAPNAGPMIADPKGDPKKPRTQASPQPNKARAPESPNKFIASTQIFPETCSTNDAGSVSRINLASDYCVVEVPGVGDYLTEVMNKPIKDTRNNSGGFKVDFFDDKASRLNISFANNFVEQRNRSGCSTCVWSFFALLLWVFWLGVFALIGVSVWMWSDYYGTKMGKLGIAQWWQGWVFWFVCPMVGIFCGVFGCFCLLSTKTARPIPERDLGLDEDTMKGKELIDN